jgi:OmpA-OmpF porin, OOP family
MLKGDFKFIDVPDVQETDKAASVSLAYAFGQRSRPAAATPAARTATPSAVADSDNDGVPDNRDACSNTPAGMRVDSRGCEIDTDRDGVVDSRDNCPDTTANLAVDNNGCPILEVAQRRQELRVNFDYDRSEVKTQYDNEITDFAEFMEVYGNTNVVIEGHTDNVGSDEYNQALSERRANAVRDELVNENGISSNRVSTVGYGEARPVSTNNTDAGRAENRRIEAVISVEVEEQRRR